MDARFIPRRKLEGFRVAGGGLEFVLKKGKGRIMAKLLYIESSPRKNRSKSIEVAKVFIEAYRASHPGDSIVTIDLWHRKLPELDGATIDAKYQVMQGQGFSPDQRAAWQRVVEVCDEFKGADKYLFSLPMWNFGVPYKLKHYIDIITQPGQTFGYDPATGYSGLVTGKPVAVIYARGGAYGSDGSSGVDLQKGYMDLLLKFIGFTDIRSILAEPTTASADKVAQGMGAATEAARKVAAAF
jgi:FMN-dependent NADH-azoreductase